MKGILITDLEGERVSPQRNREQWKKVRGPRVGSSDLPALLGKDEYMGPWEVWDRIVLGVWRDLDHADIRRGNRQEPNAIARFEELFGLTVEPVGMIRHPGDERIVSDLDGMVIRPETWPEVITDNSLWGHITTNCRGNGALEAKVPRTPKFYEYRDTGMLVSHAIQMQHHLEVAGLEWGVLTFYNPEYDDSIAFPVVVNEKIGAWIREEIPRWYQRYVVSRERPMRPMPPPPEWPSKVPGIATVRDDEPWEQAGLLLRLRHYELVDAQENFAQTEAELLKLLGDGEDELHVVGGGVVVKRWQTSGQRRFDPSRFKAMVRLAQMEQDTDRLLTIDSDADEFFYQTEGKKKTEVTVIGPNPAEMGYDGVR